MLKQRTTAEAVLVADVGFDDTAASEGLACSWGTLSEDEATSAEGAHGEILSSIEGVAVADILDDVVETSSEVGRNNGGSNITSMI